MGIKFKSVHQYLYRIRKKLEIHTTRQILAALGKGNDMLKFTKRGAQVFHLYVKGCTGKNIGKILGMSYSGVRRHKEKMLRDNSCDSMIQLVARFYGAQECNGDVPNES